MATTAFPTRDEFAALLNESLGGEDESFEGKVVKGIVTAIENDMAVIDVGLKSEGRVALREFAAPGQKAELAVGDEVEVFVDRVENSHGEAMLSRDRAQPGIHPDRRQAMRAPIGIDLAGVIGSHRRDCQVHDQHNRRQHCSHSSSHMIVLKDCGI